MPLTLTRAILGDLIRSMLVTAGVLVTVLAFGAAIKPLADNSLFSAGQTLKYILLAIVPMLQFAIPFAAGFAATITMHRLTADNEIVAMSACGISYKKILLPIGVLGLGLTVLMLVLTQWIIPQFWGVLERTATADVTTLIQSSISRNEAFALDDNLLIYADDMYVRENPEGTDADKRLILLHVAVADVDDFGLVRSHITAEQAVADLLQTDDGLVISLAMSEAVHYDSTGQLIRLGKAVLEPIEAPSVTKEDPMAMTRGRLIAVRQNPDLFFDVRAASAELIAALQTAIASRRLDEGLRSTGNVTLADASDVSLSYRIGADRVQAGQLTTRDGRPVELVSIRDGAETRRFAADQMLLTRTQSLLGETPLFELTMLGVQVTDIATGTTNRRAELPIRNLSIPTGAEDDVRGLRSEALIARAEALPRSSSRIERLVDKLREERADSFYETTARLQQRYALSVTPLLLTLLGAVLAMWMREALPLTVYLWAFLPAIANLIIISGGDQTYRDMLDHGLVIMWSGNAILIAIICYAYMKLRKN